MPRFFFPNYALILIGLTGCVTFSEKTDEPFIEPYVLETTLEQSKVCCASLPTLPFAPFAVSEVKTVSISTLSPTYIFDDRKSYFAAIRLPALSDPTDFAIRTYLVNTAKSIALGHVFIPKLMFLDAEFRPTRTVSPEMIEKPRSSNTSFWEAKVPLQLSDAYVIIYAGSDERIRTLKMTDPDFGSRYIPIRKGGMITIPGESGYRTVPPGPTGRIEIELLGIKRRN